ncbi:MAG TPA: hypothetical protein VML00_12710, partial [Bacteroidota bacterium]|nr:hypothetical protein [Bacteroidota bacterium]
MRATNTVLFFATLIVATSCSFSPAVECAFAGGAAHDTIPDSLGCTVHPWYRLRSDGKPGRQVTFRFGEHGLSGGGALEISSGPVHEKFTLPARRLDTLDILLPPSIGVDAPAEISVRLLRGERTLEQKFAVPPMRHWTVYVYPHSHVDIGYSNTQQNVEFIHRRNIDRGIALAESTRAFPDGSKYLWNTEVMWP